MIPQQTLENYPVFGDNATKIQPDDAKMAAGFQQSDVLPAEWMNWAWNKNSKGIRDLNMGMASIEAELINILTAAGITPASATENQVITAIQQLIASKTGDLSALTTTAKTTLVAAINEHVGKTDNPHSVTKSQVGLGNVTNVATESTITQNSTKNITSGAVYAHTSNTSNPHSVTKSQVGLGNVTNVATESTITQNSTKNITSGAVYTALAGKQASLTFDTTPTANSTNPVTSGGVKTAVDAVNTALTTHTNKTGTEAHGGTTAATASKIMVRDSNGKAYGKTSATADNPTLSKTDELVNFTALYNALFPLGFVYTQLPGKKSPADLKMPGTWTEIKFGGAFLRSVGGNAKAYTGSFTCTVSGDGLTVTISGTKPTTAQLAAGDILINDSQYKTVKSYNANTGVVIMNEAFSSPTGIKSVIIGQNEAVPNITGYIKGSGFAWQVYDKGGCIGTNASTYRAQYSGSQDAPAEIYIDASWSNAAYGRTNHVEPLNITVKYWERTA